MHKMGRWIHAAREAYMHKKTIGASGCCVEWLAKTALPGEIDDLAGKVQADGLESGQGIVLAGPSVANVPSVVKALTEEMAKHRAWARDVSAIAA